MKKSRRIVSFVLAMLLVFTGVVPVYAKGNGDGGSAVSISGGGAGNWGRDYCGGGYLVSIVAYDQEVDNETSISRAALDNAYKDSILVYNPENVDYVPHCEVTVSLGIRNGEVRNNGGKLIDRNGHNVTGNVDAYTIKAVRADSTKGKNLLGFTSNFGKGSSHGDFIYETEKFHNLYGEGGSFDFNNEDERERWYSYVEDIYGRGCTLGGVTKEEWVSNDAGDNKVYCILIVPVGLMANGTSVNKASVVACLPSYGVAEKSSIINSCQIIWASYSEVGNALNDIRGYNIDETTPCFRGYVPYGAYAGGGASNLRVAANVVAYMDATNFNETFEDIKYSIVAASNPEDVEEPIFLRHTGVIEDVSYLYGDAGRDRVIDPAEDRDISELTGVDDNPEYNLFNMAESSVFTVKSKNPVLYGLNDNAICNIMSTLDERFYLTYKPSLITGVISAGKYYDMDVIINESDQYENMTDALKAYMTSFHNYESPRNASNVYVLSALDSRNITANFLSKALYNTERFTKIKSTDEKDYAKNNSKKKVGLGVQVYAKTKKVKSHLKAYDVKVDADGNFISSAEAGEYTSEKYNHMNYVDMSYKSDIGYISDSDDKMLKKVYYFLVPNDSEYGYDNNFSPDIQSASFEDWSVVLAEDEEGVSVTRTSEVAPSVGVSTMYEGFTVYAVRVYQEVSMVNEVDVESTLELQDYELSHVFQSVYSDEKVKTTSYASKKANGTLSHTWLSGYTDEGRPIYDTCSYTTYTDDFERYLWQTVSKLTGNKSIVSKNGNVGAWQTIIKKYDKEMLEPVNLGTLILTQEKIVDENVLLTRDIGEGDSLVASSISVQPSQEVDDFLVDVLDMQSSNKPADPVRGSVLRDSNYVLNTVQDLFRFQGGWVNSWNEDYSGAYDVEDEPCPHSSLHTHINAKLIEKQYKTLYVGTVLSNIANVRITEITHKYLTDTMDVGKNTEKVIERYNVVPMDSRNIDGVLPRSYALPLVKNNYKQVQNPDTGAWKDSADPIVSSFFAEVQMSAQIPNIGDTLTNINQYNVWVMSEKLRKVNSSSMYFITVDSGDKPAINQDKTYIYSDNSVSNANGQSNTKPVLYAGAGVDLVVDTNIKVSTYGYSLDIINRNDVPAGYSSYSEIIADNSDVATIWGNGSNKTDLFKSFENFSKDIFKSVDADIALEDVVDGRTNTYSNFATSLGNYKEAGAIEEGTYQIVIKDGVLDESNPSYQLMLKQLAKDYFGDESKVADAHEVFKASGIYKSIQDAIESDVSSVNTSQSYEYLGNGTHWYDEQVKTFVIRRYMNYAEYSNITLNDKLDYNMGGENLAGGNDNLQNGYNSSNCKWYLYLYFNKNLSSDYMKSIIRNWYNPSDNDHTAAVNSSSVLVNHLYIPSVDFSIASDAVAY